jgi:MFS transporter, DHA2 family, multidrug resistance protein
VGGVPVVFRHEIGDLRAAVAELRPSPAGFHNRHADPERGDLLGDRLGEALDAPRPVADPIECPLGRRPLAANACGFFVLYGTGVPVAQYMQLVVRLSPLTAGALTIPSSVAFLLGSAIAPLAARHLRVRTLLGAGLATAAAGFAMLALAPLAGGPAVIVIGTIVFAFGLAPIYVTATQAAVDAVPSSTSGAASGLSETGAELGGALGIAVLGSLLLGVYRHRIAGGPATTPLHGVPDTLGAALAAAQTMPADDGVTLAESARNAFTVAFQATEAAGALLLVLVAVAVLARERR